MATTMSQVNSIVRAEGAGAMPRPVHEYGSVVAVEVNADLISTQLRLLPISSKILILNSLLDAIPRFAAGSKFDAPSFVAHVHKVFLQRAATTHSFLGDSTEDQPRLVLMNGRSMSAKAACLEKICEKVTSGDLVRAEEVYDEIVRSCGLDNMVPAFISAYPELILSRSPIASEFPAHPRRPSKPESKSQQQSNIVQNRVMDLENQENRKPSMSYEKDPGYMAMRAASVLGRTASSLHSYQNSEYKSEGGTHTTRTSMDTSVWGLSRACTVKTVSDPPSDALSLMSRGRTLVRGTLRDRRMGRKRFSSLDSNLLSVDLGHNSFDISRTGTSPINLSPRHVPVSVQAASLASPCSRHRWTRYSEATTVASQRELNSLLRSGSNRELKSIPVTPIIFEFGEARLVSMASSKNLKRTSSVDGIFTIQETEQPTRNPRYSVLKQSYSTMCLRDDASIYTDDQRPPTPPMNLTQPRKVIVKASKRSLDKCVESPLPELKSNKGDMVDRGCSPGRFEHWGLENQTPLPASPTSPDEDLIVHVDDEHRDKILEAIMNGYRNNSSSSASKSAAKAGPANPLPTPAFSKSTSVMRTLNPFQGTVTTDCRYSEGRPSFANYEIRQPRKGSALAKSSSLTKIDYRQITSIATPPTPATTPPPVQQAVEQVRKLSDFGIIPLPASALPVHNVKVSQRAKLEEFGILPSSGSLERQNSRRSTLSKHLPSKSGYNQYPIKSDYPDRLSNPTFEDEDPGRRTMDQILALGCDDFVDQTVWTNVLARVEGLGMLKDGSVVGKLDMQYLMTTAMETFTTLPLSQQKSNPFTSPDQLAQLFVTHLERYLSSNPCVRFLIITFPFGSIRSMIALRNLLGADAMRVAMLTNPRLSTPIQSIPSSSAVNKLSNEATIALNSRKRVPLSRLGNSKAQALLGNEQIPKPIGLKKSSNLLSKTSRSSMDEEEQQSRPDFSLEITSGHDREALDRSIDDFTHKIRTVLIEKNPVYGSAIPLSPQFAIANWSAATATGRHSPTSSTSSAGSKGRRLTKQASIDTGFSPATFARARGIELGRTFSQAQRSSPTHLDTRVSDNRTSRESGEWQKLYLEMGENLEDFALDRSARSQQSSRHTPSPQQPFHFASQRTTPENSKERADSRTTMLDSDSEEDEEDEDSEEELGVYLPRQGSANIAAFRAGIAPKRDIGKALRMLGIA